MSPKVTEFWDFVDNRAVVRRIVLFFTLYVTTTSFMWAAEFAESCEKQGLEIAAIIAAVLAPISVLQSAVFKTYTEGKV